MEEKGMQEKGMQEKGMEEKGVPRSQHEYRKLPAVDALLREPAVTLLATYPTHEEALAVAQALAAAVGDPAAEAAWLARAGVDPGAGFEWQGPAGSETPFVQVVDRSLLNYASVHDGSTGVSLE